MGAAIFFSLGLAFFFSIPLITALFAKRMGRNPMLWFVLGMIIPLISTIIIFLLPDLSEKDTLQNSKGKPIKENEII